MVYLYDKINTASVGVSIHLTVRPRGLSRLLKTTSVMSTPADQSFLLSYRGTPHSTTSCSPAKRFLQRELRTRLSLVKPDTASVVSTSRSLMERCHDQHARFWEFHSGQPILARNYCRSNGKSQPFLKERDLTHILLYYQTEDYGIVIVHHHHL